ncbi:MAG TPA: co-chaperone GroES [Candidatus Saccharimonadales bacterium]|nr:co-chaperone GroES [Candidatus Saccharimonadales bacterium]
MANSVKPLPGYVFLKPNEVEVKTASGILLPEKAKGKPKTAKVIAVGEDVKNIKVGDNVIFNDDYSNIDFPIDEVPHTIVNIKHIVAVVI